MKKIPNNKSIENKNMNIYQNMKYNQNYIKINNISNSRNCNVTTKRNNIKISFKYNNNKILNMIMIIYLIILLFQGILCSESIITITINESGEQKILSDNFNFLPDQVFINDVSQSSPIKKKYSLSSPENTIKMIWNTQLTNCSNMFNGLSKIIKIDLSQFDSSKVLDLSRMFFKCFGITEIDLRNFDTHSVKTMEEMFSHCIALTSLDLSSFNTELVEDMGSMFYECDSLLYLDLTYFRTPSLTNMLYTFADCDKLISIDLSTFNTSKVKDMNGLFCWCQSLISVDLSNFDTSLVTNMISFFYKCKSLLFVNLNSFTDKSVKDSDSIASMFDDVPNYLIYCVNEKNISKILPQIKTRSSNNDCSNICFSNKKIKINLEEHKCEEDIPECSQYLYNNTCYDKCPIRTKISSNNVHLCVDLKCNKYYNYNQDGCIDTIDEGYYENDTILKTIDKCDDDCETCDKKGDSINSNCKTCKSNKFFYNGNCLTNCKNGYYKDSLNNNICKCLSNIKCKICNDESIEYNLCISCNDGYYPKENDPSHNLSYINCYNNLEGYYLDNNTIYKKCYSTCKSCNEKGNETNNNCIECIDNYIFINDTEIVSNNCYEKCNYYFYLDSSRNYHCTNNEKCPDNLKLIKEKNKCVDNCKKYDYKYEFNNTCFEKCPNGTHISAENSYLCEEDLVCPKYYNYNRTECINEIPNGYFLNNSELNTIDKCDDDCETCDKKGDSINSNCKTCKSNKFFYNGNCLLNCINGYYTDSLNNNICKCLSNIKCKICNDESVGYNLCISCNDDYYPKENDSSNNLSYINCYNNLEGYYLDNNTIYKKCYSTCKSCNEKGDETNNNCIECIDNYIFINDSEIKTNCYEKCEYYYYFDSSNKYHCTETNECPNEYKILIKEKNKCINICKNDKDYKYEFNNTCYKNCPDETFPSFFICEYKSLINNKVSEECNPEKLFNNICGTFNMSSSYKDKMINDIQKEISNGTIKIFSLIDNNGKAKDLLAKEDKILYQVTTSFNQFVIKYNFTSTINLRKCEDILREIYLIDPNIPLFILKIEKYQEGYYIPIIEYEVYNPINGEKLNLNYCNQTTIYITIPVTINEDILFKHNISSPYYNDQCNRYTSRNNTDIILKDRRNDYIENNMFLCEKNCILNSYNYTTKKVICECKAKTIFTLYSNIIFDKDKFLTKFTDIKTSSNLGVIFCYKLLFTKDGLKLNIGSYIQISIIFIHIILLFLFCIKGFKIFKNIISKIISGKEKLNNKNIINNENNIKIENNNNGENSKNIITKIKRENPNNPIKKIKYKKNKIIII